MSYQGVALEPSPAEIRRQQFEQVRRGFDPQEVGVFLERIAEMIGERDRKLTSLQGQVDSLERSLAEARAAEEAVRLTMLAATKAKDEILAGAETDADEVLSGAREEAARLTEAARNESESIVASARREALDLLESSRGDAEQLVETARAEQAALESRVALLRDVVRKTESLLKGMASGALNELTHADGLLGSVASGGGDTFDLVVGDAATAPEVEGAADPVDHLLAQLREITST